MRESPFRSGLDTRVRVRTVAGPAASRACHRAFPGRAGPGLHDGLEAEHAAEALLDAAVTRHHERAGQVTTLTVTVRPKEGAATDEEARPTPAAGVRTPS